MGTLISGKTTGKTYGKYIIAKRIEYFYDFTRSEISDVLTIG